MRKHSQIEIRGAFQGNLKNIDVNIPKDKWVVFTGVSGSGKSTLLLDVLYQESQRQYLEAMGMEGLNKPKVQSVRYTSPAISITQSKANRNPRSTVGTVTDIYTDLRMIFEKLHHRQCPKCGGLLISADLAELTHKQDDEFVVEIDCPYCGQRIPKLTRTDFSFNTLRGACETCQGLGTVLDIDESAVCDCGKSLEEGAVQYWDSLYREYQIASLYQAFAFYKLAEVKELPIELWTDLHKTILFHGVEHANTQALLTNHEIPKTVSGGRFEGIYTTLRRRLSERKELTPALTPYFSETICPACGGDRLAKYSREAKVDGLRLPQLNQYSLKQLASWVQQLWSKLTTKETSMVLVYLQTLETKLKRLQRLSLGYLTLDRTTSTLSGGEGQRIRLAALLDSPMSGVLYLLDEPTVGLHPQDTEGILQQIREIRDLENTVILIEHDPEVMRAADWIIDFGPGAGRHGGEIVAQGTPSNIMKCEDSLTGQWLQKSSLLPTARRNLQAFLHLEKVTLHNINELTVDFPLACLTALTGVSGSGKSSLLFGILLHELQKKQSIFVQNPYQFHNIVAVEQAPPTAMKRSNIATYSGVFTPIRKWFANLPEAKTLGLSEKHFSFNTKGGRCEHCEGLGTIRSHMLFFEDTEIPCPHCGGKQFDETVLSVGYKGHNIHQVLQMTVEEAAEYYREQPSILKPLSLLAEAGLDYVTLGQTVPTLSGGEAQRLQLARQLLEGTKGKTLYLLDEPTTGLHPADIQHFLLLLQKIVDAGHTVIVIEHNVQLIREADWVIDMGPGGGETGGKIIAQGTPLELQRNLNSVIGRYL
jgi:excinuclease ABC subunit A